MPIRSKISANSFISAMFRSRWVFSITFAASATLMLVVRCTPAVITRSYSAAIASSVGPSSPATTFTMRSSVCSRSPGLIRSGE